MWGEYVKIRFICIGAALSLLGCGLRSIGDNDAHVAHTIGEPVAFPAAWQWLDLPRETYISQLESWGFRERVYSEDALVSQRGQFWLEAMDRYFRAADPQGVVNVPPPRLLLLGSRAHNGFTGAVNLCFNVDIDAPSRAPTYPGEVTSSQYLFLGREGYLRPAAMNCHQDFGDDLSLLQTIIDDFNADQTDPEACHLRLTGRRLSTWGQCRVDPGVSPANRLTVLVNSPYITIFEGIIRDWSEDEFVAILAHELGHYYRAHTTASESRFSYFYQEEPAGNAPSRPVPAVDPQQKALAREVRTMALRFATMPAAPGVARLNRSVFSSLVLSPQAKFRGDILGWEMVVQSPILGPRSGLPPFFEECRSFTKLATPANIGVVFDYADSSSSDALQTYMDLENAFLQCAARLTPGALSFLDWSLIDAGIPDWIREEYLQSEQRQREVTTFADMVVAASDFMQVVEQDYLTLLNRVRDARLGWYTGEQEADEISMELLAALGQDPRAAIRVQFNFLRERVNSREFGYETCSRFAEAGFRNPDGSEAYVPVGYVDTHHSSCFRALNLHRELEAHHYEQWETVSQLDPPGGSWEDVRRSLR